MPRYRRNRPKNSRRAGGSAPASPPRNDGGSASKASKPAPRTPSKLPGHYFSPEKRSLWPSSLARSAMTPYSLVSRRWRDEIPHMLTVFVLVLFLYGWTTPRLVALEDDGLFISNLHFFGVAHPPGYPIHTLLGTIFYHILPFGTPAFKGHFFSGFAAAGACVAIYAIVAMLVRGRIFAYLGGMAYGVSDTFWSQAIIAEVYSLNAMFFFIVMALCLLYGGNVGRSGRQHRRLFMAITIIYGMAVANHYPLLGLGSIALGLVVLSQIGNIFPRVFLGALGVFLGAAPAYVLMVWRSGWNPAENPANFYGPIGLLGMNEREKIVDFPFYFGRSGYSGVDKQSGVGLEDKLAFAESLGNDMLWQFTPLGFAFVAIGFCVMARSRFNWLWASLFTGWFMTSFLLVYLLDFKAEFIWMAAFRVYHLLAFGIMAIWLAIGAAWSADRFMRFSPLAARAFGTAALASVVTFTVSTHWEKNNRKDYSWAHDLAVAKLSSVEPNAVLFTFDDLDLPVGYLHFVEGLRPDLKVYNDQALVYGDRLYSPLMPDYPPPQNPAAASKTSILRRFIENTDRPIYYHAAREKLYAHPRYGSDLMGFFRRVNREGPEQRIILSDYMRQWLDVNIDKSESITDLWTRQQHFSTVSQLVIAVELASYHGLTLSADWSSLIDRAREKNALARLSSNSQKFNFNRLTLDDARKELEWMKSFDPASEPLLGRQLRSNFFWQKAHFGRMVNDEEVPFEETLVQGRDADPAPENPASQQLLALYRSSGRQCDLVKLAERLYPDPVSMPRELLHESQRARREGSCEEEEA